MQNVEFNQILPQFKIEGTIESVKPLGNGLINDTYLVVTKEENQPNYVLQRINDSIFTNVELLQHNIELVTNHMIYLNCLLEFIYSLILPTKIFNKSIRSHYIPSQK